MLSMSLRDRHDAGNPDEQTAKVKTSVNEKTADIAPVPVSDMTCQ